MHSLSQQHEESAQACVRAGRIRSVRKLPHAECLAAAVSELHEPLDRSLRGRVQAKACPVTAADGFSLPARVSCRENLRRHKLARPPARGSGRISVTAGADSACGAFDGWLRGEAVLRLRLEPPHYQGGMKCNACFLR